MYVLDFLSEAIKERPGKRIEVEHRLLCSGELYNRRVVTFDWRNEKISRVLLREPCEMYVASRPFEAFPQEICLRLALPYITEVVEGNLSGVRMFLPDHEVVEDLCSILSLLSRRLISPYVKTREQDPEILDGTTGFGSYDHDIPSPIEANQRRSAWVPRSATVITSFNGQSVIENAPRPVGVDGDSLTRFLKQLPSADFARQIVSACRLYRTALELIETRSDIAYQLLISTIECLAGAVLRNFEPQVSDKLATKEPVRRRAKSYGLDESQANDLALRACQGMAWTKRKFVKFLMDRLTKTDLSAQDTVFMIPEHFCPSPDLAEQALGQIYDARSSNLHGGSGFPPTAGIGTSPYMDARHMFQRPAIPPVTWYERLVSVAAVKFLLEQTKLSAAPFIEWGPEHC